MQTSHLLARRQLLSLLGGTCLAASASPSAWAQTAALSKKTASSAGWRLLINEAVTGEVNSFVLTNRYRPLADFISLQIKGRAVAVEPVVDIKRFMTVAQGAIKPELVFGKSVNQLAKLVRDNGYQPIVKRADAYKSAFIVLKDSPIKTLADAAGVKIFMPDAVSATSAVALAELRWQKVAATRITHVKFQEEVAQSITNGFAQMGAVNPTVAKKWVEDGGRVVAQTQPVVNWSLLASPSVTPEAVVLLRDALMGTNAEAAAVLTAVGVKEWAKAERKDYLDLLTYTKE